MSPLLSRQRGAALLLTILLVVLACMAILITGLNRRFSAFHRDRITADALAQAKAALIGYAAGSTIDIYGTLVNAARPGDLPCPDLDDDGLGESSTGCGNGTGTTGQSLRLGRLPWKELGLPDLRDGSGERLWYAVSNTFKRRTRYNGAVNSDTPGTITLRDGSGQVVFNGSAAAGTGLVAVIIAPGAPLSRPTSLADATPYRQSRGSGDANLPVNYLDLGLGEDNAGFTDGSGTDGFIAGPVLDAAGNTLVNDRLAWIAAEELAPYLERRVVAEVAQCLREYGYANGGRYPWPAAGSLGTAAAVNYDDTANRRLGRVPDNPFSNSKASGPDMSINWTGNCNINSTSGWWPNWKEVVFYGLSDKHKPFPSRPVGGCGIAGFSGNTCLALDGNSDRQFIVLAAGRRLAANGQLRSGNGQRNTLSNYLEGANSSDDDLFANGLHGLGGNDILKAAPW